MYQLNHALLLNVSSYAGDKLSTGVDAELIERMEWAEATTAGNAAHHAVRGVQLRRPHRDPRRRGALRPLAASPLPGRPLDAPDMHDPELLIRTSGERRISNYLLWQLAYSELHFSDVLWPDFSRADFEAALADYEARDRRFGGR